MAAATSTAGAKAVAAAAAAAAAAATAAKKDSRQHDQKHCQTFANQCLSSHSNLYEQEWLFQV